LLAPGAGSVAAQSFREAESLFLAKFQVLDSEKSQAAVTGARGRGKCARAAGKYSCDGGAGRGAAEATEGANVCESVKEDKASFALVEAERKLVAVAESNECSVCMGHKNHVLIPCGHLCVFEQCASNIMVSSKQCPVRRSMVVQILKVYY